MAEAPDDVFVATRRQLRGVAESLIAGPQYRAAGTIRLAVRPDGFTGTILPVSVRGTELIWPQGSAPLEGTLGRLADEAGLAAGPPAGVYDIADPLPPDAVLDLDPDSAEWIYRSLSVGAHALTIVLPEQHPVLWPEHFDVAVSGDEVNYGVSPGDSYHRRPYAYVGPWTPHSGPFWNAPFGAIHPLEPADDARDITAAVVDFFARARNHLHVDRSSK